MTVCEGWHELLVRVSDPEDALTHNGITYRLVVGEDDSTPAYSNDELNVEIARIDVTDFIAEDNELFFSTFVDSTEANPDTGAFQSIVEAGIVADIDDEPIEYLCNHSVIPEIQKDELTTATIDFTLEQNNDPGDP